jgi:hypothetical protein
VAKLEGHISDALADKAERAAEKNGTQTLTAAALLPKGNRLTTPNIFEQVHARRGI